LSGLARLQKGAHDQGDDTAEEQQTTAGTIHVFISLCVLAANLV
jgi:hypothetical protein